LLDRGKLVALDRPAALKEQVGGDVLTVTPAKLREAIEKRFNLKATVVDNTVRIERPRGHEFIPALIEAFPGEIDAVSVGKPTLEDVFIHLTGHRFEES
jgi:ABC-2 type transport system ATP-binding protein